MIPITMLLFSAAAAEVLVLGTLLITSSVAIGHWSHLEEKEWRDQIRRGNGARKAKQSFTPRDDL